MIQMTYVSVARSNLAADELFRIIEVSSRNNSRDDLTGFLVFSQNRFFQLIEGPDEKLDGLLVRINADPRHSDIQILSRKTVAARSFPRWHMKRLQPGNGQWQVIEDGTGNRALPPEVREKVKAFLRPGGAFEPASTVMA